jgi:hypothetical protein
MDDRENMVSFPLGTKHLSLPQSVKTGSGSPSSPQFNGYQLPRLRALQPLRQEADHSHPCTSEIRKVWRYNSTTSTFAWHTQGQLHLCCSMYKNIHIIFTIFHLEYVPIVFDSVSTENIKNTQILKSLSVV